MNGSKDAAELEALNLFAADPETYNGIDHDRLVAYVVMTLSSANIKATFENVTVGAFRLFPNVFCIDGFPQYPDAARVNRTLLHGGPKYRDYLVGRATTGYTLSPRGETAARETTEMLSGTAERKQHRGRAKAPRNFSERMQSEVRRSDAFLTWKSNMLIADEDFYLFLHLLPNSRKEAVRENLATIRENLEGVSDPDISDFMTFLQSRFAKEIG